MYLMSDSTITPPLTSLASHSQTKGMLAMLAAMLIYTAINAFLKTAEQVYAPTQIVFIRNLFSLIPYLFLVMIHKEWSTLRIPNYGVHLGRAFLGVISLGCLFQSILLLPLADAITLSYASC